MPALRSPLDRLPPSHRVRSSPAARDGIKTPSTIVQELLHNFGLIHGSKDTTTPCTCHDEATCECHDEYGDLSTPMVRCSTKGPVPHEHRRLASR